MKKLILLVFLICELFIVSESYSGYVYGWIWRKYVCGIPPQYCYTKNWDNATVRWIKLVRPDGTVASYINNWNSTYYCTNMVQNECLGTYYQFHFWTTENITNWKLHIYAYYDNKQYVQVVNVPSNGAVLDFIVMDDVSGVGSPSPNINLTCPPYPNPFGCPLPNTVNLTGFGGGNVFRTKIEKSTDQNNWTEIANLDPNVTSYQTSTTYNTPTYFRSKVYYVFPENHFTIEKDYSAVSNITTKSCADFTGPTSLSGGEYGTWTAVTQPSNLSYQWRKRVNGGSWSGVIGTQSSITLPMGSQGFDLQLTVLGTNCATIDDIGQKNIQCKNCDENEDRLTVSENPLNYELFQNYPNPFNPTTVIKYNIKNDGITNIKIYDVLGNEVRTLIDSYEKAGYKEILWDGKSNTGNQVASGTYIYKIVSGEFTDTKKMLLVR